MKDINAKKIELSLYNEKINTIYLSIIKTNVFKQCDDILQKNKYNFKLANDLKFLTENENNDADFAKKYRSALNTLNSMLKKTMIETDSLKKVIISQCILIKEITPIFAKFEKLFLDYAKSKVKTIVDKAVTFEELNAVMEVITMPISNFFINQETSPYLKKKNICNEIQNKISTFKETNQNILLETKIIKEQSQQMYLKLSEEFNK